MAIQVPAGVTKRTGACKRVGLLGHGKTRERNWAILGQQHTAMMQTASVMNGDV
ncbi:uncharacterized protein GLRG_03806 [Colletotrichum graminicola M1.001]|uniref:Uncharacterized protein n=1 Tax=Colletotrichum graminicola (strain M1.001 / M2 / FGSC 10212) TaxID=645133 RepID=E3QCS4_COLGM|nr:uncharacterized protein GLRG_03806 [Colletotrichum graminicola M1.001]EFQ28662.1 hypothetical protein GLRG_03806 [Colletotrichum graminicola M1.001]